MSATGLTVCAQAVVALQASKQAVLKIAQAKTAALLSSKSSRRTVLLFLTPLTCSKKAPRATQSLRSQHHQGCRHRTLGQNHKKHSIALLGPFVLKKEPNRGIKCQSDILEKNPKGGPFYVKNFFVSDFAQILYVKWLCHKNFKFHQIQG